MHIRTWNARLMILLTWRFSILIPKSVAFKEKAQLCGLVIEYLEECAWSHDTFHRKSTERKYFYFYDSMEIFRTFTVSYSIVYECGPYRSPEPTQSHLAVCRMLYIILCQPLTLRQTWGISLHDIWVTVGFCGYSFIIIDHPVLYTDTE